MELISLDSLLLLAATAAADAPSIWAKLGGYLWMFGSVALGLGFVIFVHELGHFLVAKAVGVKCEKFYIGFDFFELKLGPITIPRALAKFQWGETEYGIGILPLGGYVKMLGQDDDPRNAEAEAERAKEATINPDAGIFNPDDVATSELAENPAKRAKLDPRSYPAKSVPARMAIISAGVIMNIIFGILLAAVAFKIGVPEIPAIVGGTIPGDPAWRAGLQPGDKIIQIGKGGEPYENLRFNDLTRAVVFGGADRDLDLLVRRNDEEKWYAIRPTTRIKELSGHPSLGVQSFATNKLALPAEAEPSLLPVATPALQDGDIIKAVDGQLVKSEFEIAAALARKVGGPVSLTIDRSPNESAGKEKTLEPPQTLEVSVEPRPYLTVGVAMTMGPVEAIRNGSAAESAGFLVGDVIQQLDGQPVGDPLTLAQRLVGKADQSVTFTVARKDSDGKAVTKELSVSVPQPTSYFEPNILGGPAAVNSLGLAFAVSPTVAAVQADTPAAKAGIQVGDVVKQIEFVPTSDASRELWAKSKLEQPIVLEGQVKTWMQAFYLMQSAPPDTDVKITYDRGGKIDTATLQLVAANDFFDESRALNCYPERTTLKAATWGEALWLGGRELKERLLEVVTVLGKLLTGQISPGNLSGIPGIAAQAGASAKQGLPTLLMFLTMLSANLAILNFLPIPALDGGHMIFLAAEGIRGKPVDERLQMRLTVVGVLLLLSLMVFATAMDINRFLG